MTSDRINEKTESIDYNDFIKSLEIENIRLMSAEIKILDTQYFPETASISWRESSRYENRGDQIDVFHRFNVRILDEGKEVKSRISVTFYVTYDSKIPMTKEYFNRFKERNLPLNTWPYFREFLHNTLSRIGWPPFIIPAYVA